MLMSVRAILHYRRVVTRSISTSWIQRYNSTQSSRERDAFDKEKDSSRAIPLPTPSPGSHASPTPERTQPQAHDHTTMTTDSQSSTTHESTTTSFDSHRDQTEWKKNLSSYDLELVKSRIRNWTEQAAVGLRDRADGFTNHTKTRFSRLGAELSKATGYEEIEVLKREVVEQGLFPFLFLFV
jgi:sensitive to high expression protein 9